MSASGRPRPPPAATRRHQPRRRQRGHRRPQGRESDPYGRSRAARAARLRADHPGVRRLLRSGGRLDTELTELIDPRQSATSNALPADPSAPSATRCWCPSRSGAAAIDARNARHRPQHRPVRHHPARAAPRDRRPGLRVGLLPPPHQRLRRDRRALPTGAVRRRHRRGAASPPAYRTPPSSTSRRYANSSASLHRHLSLHRRPALPAGPSAAADAARSKRSCAPGTPTGRWPTAACRRARRPARHRGHRPGHGVRQHEEPTPAPASGSPATRPPGESRLYLDFLPGNAQGEDVVAGRHADGRRRAARRRRPRARPPAGDRADTPWRTSSATPRTSSSPSRTEDSGYCRPERPNAPRGPPSRSPVTSSTSSSSTHPQPWTDCAPTTSTTSAARGWSPSRKPRPSAAPPPPAPASPPVASPSSPTPHATTPSTANPPSWYAKRPPPTTSPPSPRAAACRPPPGPAPAMPPSSHANSASSASSTAPNYTSTPRPAGYASASTNSTRTTPSRSTERPATSTPEPSRSSKIIPPTSSNGYAPGREAVPTDWLSGPARDSP